MTLKNLLMDVSLIHNDYVVISLDTAVLDDGEYFTFYTGSGWSDEELLYDVADSCPRLLDREVVSIFATVAEDGLTRLEILVSW